MTAAGGTPRRAALYSVLVTGLLAGPVACSPAQTYPRAAPQASSADASQSDAAGAGLFDRLGPAERALADTARQTALETVSSNETYRWRHGTGGVSGFVTPLRTFKIATGHYCREFLEAVATADGLLSEVRTACRDDDATWQTVKR